MQPPANDDDVPGSADWSDARTGVWNPPVIRVAVVDNHAVVRAGVVGTLGAVDDLEVIASAGNVSELDVTGWGPDVVVLLDLWLDDGDTIEAIPDLVATGARVLLYTTEERPVPLRRAVAAGALGLILKTDPLSALENGVRMAAGGSFCCSGPLAHALLTDHSAVADLSERQVEILRCLADGLDYPGVARSLGCQPGTVKTHLARIRERFRAIGVEPGNSHHLVRLAIEQGHLSPQAERSGS